MADGGAQRCRWFWTHTGCPAGDDCQYSHQPSFARRLLTQVDESFGQYAERLERQGFGKPVGLQHLTIADLRMFGVPEGHARAIIGAVNDKPSWPEDDETHAESQMQCDPQVRESVVSHAGHALLPLSHPLPLARRRNPLRVVRGAATQDGRRHSSRPATCTCTSTSIYISTITTITSTASSSVRVCRASGWAVPSARQHPVPPFPACSPA